jgi:hypothetical protein
MDVTGEKPATTADGKQTRMNKWKKAELNPKI